MPVVVAKERQAIRPGVVYIARPDQHLVVTDDRRFVHRDGRRIQFVRSSANPLLETASEAFDGHLVAVVLTGSGSDAASGIVSVKAHGGRVIAQDPSTAAHSGMPAAAVPSGAVDYVLPLDAIAPALSAIVRGLPVGQPAELRPEVSA
jgi:two-component system, chemotaxis family, protein-glutamate methylesterase/glutaminase